MKKLKFLIITIALVLAIAVFYTASFTLLRSAFMPRGSFKADEEVAQLKDGKGIISDDYATLGVKDGKLYYAHFRNYISPDGVYEIDENGYRRLDDANDVYSIIDPDYEPVPMGDEDYEEEPVDEEDELLEKLTDIYRFHDDYEYLYTFTDDTLIYLSKDFYIKEIDIDTQKCLFKQKLNFKIRKNPWDYELYKFDGKIILADSPNKTLKIYDISDKCAEIFSKEALSYEYYCYTYHNNQLFIGSENDDFINKCGLDVVNLKTRESRHIYDGKVRQMGMFGDKWVYIVDNDRNLYRVTQDGKTKETLFKIGW